MRAIIAARERTRRALEARHRRLDIRPRLAGDRRRMDQARATAIQTIRVSFARRRGILDQLTAHLSQLSPLRILERGYAIVSNKHGILRDSSAAPPESRIHVRLAKGGLDAVVLDRLD
jgi:exodeoxyribonuclease VII large subunit